MKYVLGVALVGIAAGACFALANPSPIDTLFTKAGMMILPHKGQDRIFPAGKGFGTVVVPDPENRITRVSKPITVEMEPSAADLAAYDYMLAIGLADTGKPDH
ncbi:MAG TPA: hypothetical protein VHD31_00765 [Candidatus Paceibacterota bacterium]|nr:hypothetical protein [Candidatus Paceibacterota bacterium]